MLRHEWRQKVDKHRGPTKAERAGYDLWGRYSINKGGCTPVEPYYKTLTHRIERRKARDVIRRELQMEGAA